MSGPIDFQIFIDKYFPRKIDLDQCTEYFPKIFCQHTKRIHIIPIKSAGISPTWDLQEYQIGDIYIYMHKHKVYKEICRTIFADQKFRDRVACPTLGHLPRPLKSPEKASNTTFNKTPTHEPPAPYGDSC